MASLVSPTELFASDSSPELEAAQQLEEAARFLDLEKWIVQRLRYCEREVQLHSQIVTDTSEPRIVRAVRVQHSSVRGPGMGPLLFSRQLPNSDIHALAMSLSWQWALWKLPFSGSAGLISADLDELSEREARMLTRDYVDQLRGVLGPQSDVIAPARDCHPQVMAWALSAIGAADRRTLASITGKPASLGGVDVAGIAARFFRILFGCVMKQYAVAAKGARVAMLGFDQATRRMALELERTGTRIVAVADRSGGVHDPAGLNIQLLIRTPKKNRCSLATLRLSKPPSTICCRSPATPWFVRPGGAAPAPGGSCDLRSRWGSALYLAHEDSRHSFFARRLRPQLRFVSANGARTPVEASPKSMASADCRSTFATPGSEVWNYAQKHGLALPQAALTLAVSRVAEAMRMK